MPSLPRYLQKLGRDLDALPSEYDAMMLSELDGFIAALVVCPVAIGEEEWLQNLWRDVAEDGETKLDMAAAHALIPDVLEHHRRVVLQLKADEDGYAPIYDVADDDSLVWQVWAMGFGEGMQLNMESWAAIAESDREKDEDASAALGGLMAAVSMAHGVSLEELRQSAGNDSVDFEAIAADAAELIPLWVEILFDWRLAHRPDPAQTPIRVTKVGRNDPCPCGSGRKHKKCCGSSIAA